MQAPETGVWMLSRGPKLNHALSPRTVPATNLVQISAHTLADCPA
jgi:hypothetical protein